MYDCELIATPCQALLQRLASAVFYHGALCFFSVARCSDILLPTPWANLIQARYWEQDANVPPDAKKDFCLPGSYAYGTYDWSALAHEAT